MTLLGMLVMVTATACGGNGQDGIGANASELEREAEDAIEQIEDELAQNNNQPDQPVEPAEETPDWPLIALIAAIAIAVILLIGVIISALRRRGDASDMQQRLRDEALLETDWLIEAASERPSHVDAAPRARDIRVRVDRLSDATRRLEGMSGRRTAEASADLRADASALARSMIARLDDVAAGRSESNDLGLDDLVERTHLARDRFISAT